MIDGLGVGLAERDVAKRFLATAVVLLVVLVCVGGFVYMVFYWPLWIAFPAGLILMAIGAGVSIFIVDRIVGKKVKAPHDRFGE